MLLTVFRLPRYTSVNVLIIPVLPDGQSFFGLIASTRWYTEAAADASAAAAAATVGIAAETAGRYT